ncbi:hypothetical protein MTO96_020770 [Rhipicephalus appendiculatus]
MSGVSTHSSDKLENSSTRSQRSDAVHVGDTTAAAAAVVSVILCLLLLVAVLLGAALFYGELAPIRPQPFCETTALRHRAPGTPHHESAATSEGSVETTGPSTSTSSVIPVSAATAPRPRTFLPQSKTSTSMLDEYRRIHHLCCARRLLKC